MSAAQNIAQSFTPGCLVLFGTTFFPSYSDSCFLEVLKIAFLGIGSFLSLSKLLQFSNILHAKQNNFVFRKSLFYSVSFYLFILASGLHISTAILGKRAFWSPYTEAAHYLLLTSLVIDGDFFFKDRYVSYVVAVCEIGILSSNSALQFLHQQPNSSSDVWWNLYFYGDLASAGVILIGLLVQALFFISDSRQNEYYENARFPELSHVFHSYTISNVLSNTFPLTVFPVFFMRDSLKQQRPQLIMNSFTVNEASKFYDIMHYDANEVLPLKYFLKLCWLPCLLWSISLALQGGYQVFVAAIYSYILAPIFVINDFIYYMAIFTAVRLMIYPIMVAVHRTEMYYIGELVTGALYRNYCQFLINLPSTSKKRYTALLKVDIMRFGGTIGRTGLAIGQIVRLVGSLYLLAQISPYSAPFAVLQFVVVLVSRSYLLAKQLQMQDVYRQTHDKSTGFFRLFLARVDISGILDRLEWSKLQVIRNIGKEMKTHNTKDRYGELDNVISAIFMQISLASVVFMPVILDGKAISVQILADIVVMQGISNSLFMLLNFYALGLGARDTWIHINEIFTAPRQKRWETLKVAGTGGPVLQLGQPCFILSQTFLVSFPSLALNLNQHCFLFGETGSGKTSACLSLLGELELIRGLLKRSASTSYLAQKPWLFEGTIAENIYAQHAIPDDSSTVMQLLKSVGFEEDTFLNKEKHMVVTGGSNLSGGQCQRVALARCFAKDYEFVILDEPFAALDQKAIKICLATAFRQDRQRSVLITSSIKVDTKQCAWKLLISKGSITLVDHVGQSNSITDVVDVTGTKENGDDKPFTLTIQAECDQKVEGKILIHIQGPDNFAEDVAMKEAQSNVNPKIPVMEGILETTQGKALSLFTIQFSVQSRDKTIVPIVGTKHSFIPAEVSDGIFYAGSMTITPASTNHPKKVENGEFVLPKADGFQLHQVYGITLLVSFAFFILVRLGLGVATFVFLKEASQGDPAESYSNIMWYFLVPLLENIFILVSREALMYGTRQRMLVVSQRITESVSRTSPTIVLSAKDFIYSVFLTDISKLEQAPGFVITVAADTSFALGLPIFVLIQYGWQGLFFVGFGIVFALFMSIIQSNKSNFIRVMVEWQAQSLAACEKLLESRVSIRLSNCQHLFLESTFAKYMGRLKVQSFFVLFVSLQDQTLVLLDVVISVTLVFAMALSPTPSSALFLLGIYLLKGIWAVKRIGSLYGHYTQTYALNVSCQRLTQVFLLPSVEQLKAEVRIKKSNLSSQSIASIQRKGLIVKDVSVSYKFLNNNIETIALRDISFTVPKGKSVALIGPSGCGKSTLLNALLGYCPLLQGSIMIDEGNINTTDHKTWLKKISYAPQSPLFFGQSIRSELNFTQKYSERQLYATLRRCAIYNEVVQLPGKLDANITQCSSSGFLQQLSNCRALLGASCSKNTALAIFDEPTSSLGYFEEKMLLETFRTLDKVALVVISHRMLICTVVDSVIRLKNGEMEVADFNNEN